MMFQPNWQKMNVASFIYDASQVGRPDFYLLETYCIIPSLPMNKRIIIQYTVYLIRFPYVTFLVWFAYYSPHKLLIFYGLMICL